MTGPMTGPLTGPAARTGVALAARGLRVGYDADDVLTDLSVEIPTGKITAIIGANACGKSTLLKTMARLIRPRAGVVELDGGDIHRVRSIEVARRLAMLPQSPIAPEGITVGDLVARGRYPRHGLFRRWSHADDEAVARALTETGTLDLIGRPVQELSGGQRQRVWIAMCLAQETEIVLLDEPTAALDLAHAVDVLELLTDLNTEAGRTIVMVLHELNQAARYADHLIAMCRGRIVAQGSPAQVLVAPVVSEVFGLDVRVVPDPVTGTPMVVPLRRRSSPRNPRNPGLDEPEARSPDRSAH